MRAWVVRRPGPPEALDLTEVEDPVPGDGQVVVRVRAIGLNFADCMARLGVYPNTPRSPFVPGMEVAGEVVAAGGGVSGLRPGNRVFAVPIFGGHAELVAVPATHVAPLPEDMGWDEAAGLAVTGLTADWALNVVGRVRAGERVLVTAAAGGVGTMVLQLAQAQGARVLAVASTERKRALALELGAEAAAGYDDWAEVADQWGGLDLILDSVGGGLFQRAWRRLAGDGRYVLYGFSAASGRRRIRWLRAAGAWLAMGCVHPLSLVSGTRTLAGFNLSLVPTLAEQLHERHQRLLEARGAGRLRVVIGGRYRFRELPDAHAALQGRESTGKLVVLVD
jgi:2-desacetyl-2-hydroxyethyl bacteriochlorophyllide A dehydrogenase